jgi:hypothetical protein
MSVNQEQPNMEKSQLAQLAGYVDGAGTVGVTVAKREQYKIGYAIRPVVKISLKHESDLMVGKILAYADENGIEVEEKDNRLIVEGRQPVEAFLSPLVNYLVTKYDQTLLLLDVLFPMMEREYHLDRDGFIEAMEVVDEIRGYNENRGTEVKYDKEYFEDLWA